MPRMPSLSVQLIAVCLSLIHIRPSDGFASAPALLRRTQTSACFARNNPALTLRQPQRTGNTPALMVLDGIDPQVQVDQVQQIVEIAEAARMVLDGIEPQVDDQVQQIVEMAEAAPSILISAYQSALATYPTGTDALTGMSLYFLGKGTSGAIAKNPPSMLWLARWMICGLCDGACTHQWYLFLDSMLSNLGLEHWTAASIMTLLSTTIYTPLYSVAFLGGLTLLEGKGWEGAKERVKKDYRQLTTASMVTWGPINLILFGAVESELRVAASESVMFLYLVVLALWNEGFFFATEDRSVLETLDHPHSAWREADFLGMEEDDDEEAERLVGEHGRS